MSTGLEVALLLAWGAIVAMDLVSVPQVMVARPVIAGTVAGLIAGDPAAGALAGVVLELFALDVLPVGATRYPDFGPGTVGAAFLLAHAPDSHAWLGVAVGIALVVALAGGWSLQWLRHRIARDVQESEAELRAGSTRAIRSLQYTSLGRDAVRGLSLSMVAVGAAGLALRVPLDGQTGGLLTLIAIGGGLAAAAGAVLRGGVRGTRLGWIAAGLAAGGVVAWLR